MLKTINTNNSIFQITAAEVEAQQTSTLTPAPVQEVTPKYTKINKITKTPKTPTIKSTYKSFSTQHGYFVPATLKPNITHITHTTTLILSCITLGYALTCKVNGEAQTSVVGDDCHTDWILKLQAGDRVEVEVLGGKSTKNIIYTVAENGVTAEASEGVKHSIKGTHKDTPDIQDKYRKGASQETVKVPAQVEETVSAAPVTQETPAQIEEETVAAPAQEKQIINFGKHTGEAVSSLSSSYLKWLVAHESRLAQANRWACTAAKAILAARQKVA